MIRIRARRLLLANPSVLWEQLTDYYEVEFDDKTIVMHGSDITLSRYTWDFHRDNTNIPLLSSMTVIPYLKHGIFTASTMRSLFNHILWIVYDFYKQSISPHDLAERCQFMNMYLYNGATKYTARHISSLHVSDYFDLLYHPQLVDMKRKVEEGGWLMSDVDDAINQATKLINSPVLTGANGKTLTLPLSCIAGVTKAPQTVQAVFMRGTIPDLKMESIPYPVTSSLAEGMNTPLDYAILSREGAISAMASLDDLQTVCYNGRKLSLVTQAKKTLVEGDCGSTNYIYWGIHAADGTTDTTDNLASDLKHVLGMWYKADTGELRQITKADTHLQGTTILRRSPLTCKLHNGQQICTTCFGQLSESFDRSSNSGITISKQFAQDKAQATLSLKHLLASLMGEAAKLDSTARKYLSVENNTYYLTQDVINTYSSIVIEVSRSSVYSLAPLEAIPDVYGLIPSRISSFKEVTLHLKQGDKRVSIDIQLSKSSVRCMFSYDVLDLIKRYNAVSLNDTSCLVDVSRLGTKPIFIKPEALPPISEMSKNLSKIFERVGAEGQEIGGRDIIGTLGRLQGLLQVMGPTHLALVETLLAAYLTKEGTFNVTNAVNGLSELFHASGDHLMLKRSLAVWMIYNSPVTAFLNNPGTFNIKDRDDSILDVFIDPAGIV